MSSKDKKLVQERIKIPAYGDEKIDEAKGKFVRAVILWDFQIFGNFCMTLIKVLTLTTFYSLIRPFSAGAKKDWRVHHLDQNWHRGVRQEPSHSRRVKQKRES